VIILINGGIELGEAHDYRKSNNEGNKMSLTELPFHLQGNIFRSPMPFGDHDIYGETFHEFEREKISVIVLLAEDKECEQKAGRNLRELYIRGGFQVIHFPIPDFGVPLKEDLEHFAQKTIKCAKKGHNIAIHCSAGIGRTGLFAAYLAKQVLGLSGEEAINWVRQYIDGAVETDEQMQLITEYKYPVPDVSNIQKRQADVLYPDRIPKMKAHVCMTCNGRVEGFRDEPSQKEFLISGMCQLCQDKIFNMTEEEESEESS
jgi:protein-tyrosine phosphatase